MLSADAVAAWKPASSGRRGGQRKFSNDAVALLIPLENMLLRIAQQDVVHRHHLNPEHVALVPDFGVFAKVLGPEGKPQVVALSRQLVLFCVERRKTWRLLRSKAGIVNKASVAQRTDLADLDAGKITREELFARGPEMMEELITGTTKGAV